MSMGNRSSLSSIDSISNENGTSAASKTSIEGASLSPTFQQKRIFQISTRNNVNPDYCGTTLPDGKISENAFYSSDKRKQGIINVDAMDKFDGDAAISMVLKRERMATHREEIAVQKANETELNKTIHITEETMRAKQMLATMSLEIRSPLTRVVSMAEILSNSKLDQKQRQLLDVMISSGDLALHRINDVLDLSKVESGVMRLDATKFRPREVVKHVLQTAAASLQKELTLEGHVAEGVPVELYFVYNQSDSVDYQDGIILCCLTDARQSIMVIGDVLRVRQILINLISNAIKLTHEGRVGINLYVVPDPEDPGKSEEFHQNHTSNLSAVSENHQKEKRGSEASHDQTCNGCLEQNGSPDEGPSTPVKHLTPADESQASETAVWIRCDVYDTGIGIPEKEIPTLFKKYMQVSADHARKYGGTGLGLAICTQLVELMGGSLTVTTKEHCGSTFTFLLPYKISLKGEPQDGPVELYDMEEHEIVSDANNDDTVACYFNFRPRTLGSLFSSAESMGTHKPPPKCSGFDPLNKLKIQSEKPYSFLSSNCSVTADVDSFSDIESSLKELEPSESYALCGGKTCQSNSSILKNPTMDSHDCGETCMEVDNKDEPKESHVACQGQAQETRSSQLRSCSSTESPKSDSKPRIVLVEDNKINVMVAKSMIKQIGHDIDVVNDGVEAVRAVQTHNYDLVLMVQCSSGLLTEQDADTCYCLFPDLDRCITSQTLSCGAKTPGDLHFSEIALCQTSPNGCSESSMWTVPTNGEKKRTVDSVPVSSIHCHQLSYSHQIVFGNAGHNAESSSFLSFIDSFTEDLKQSYIEFKPSMEYIEIRTCMIEGLNKFFGHYPVTQDALAALLEYRKTNTATDIYDGLIKKLPQNRDIQSILKFMLRNAIRYMSDLHLLSLKKLVKSYSKDWKPISLGTIIAAVEFRGGVAFAADSRESSRGFLGCRVIRDDAVKIINIFEGKIVMLLAGDAKRCLELSESVKKNALLYATVWGSCIPLDRVTQSITEDLKRNKHDSHIIVVGWGKKAGTYKARIVKISKSGDQEECSYALTGSGGQHVERCALDHPDLWPPRTLPNDISKGEAQRFLVNAAIWAIDHDVQCGGNINLGVMEDNGVSNVFPVTPWIAKWIFNEYRMYDDLEITMKECVGGRAGISN